MEVLQTVVTDFVSPHQCRPQLSALVMAEVKIYLQQHWYIIIVICVLVHRPLHCWWRMATSLYLWSGLSYLWTVLYNSKTAELMFSVLILPFIVTGNQRLKLFGAYLACCLQHLVLMSIVLCNMCTRLLLQLCFMIFNISFRYFYVCQWKQMDDSQAVQLLCVAAKDFYSNQVIKLSWYT